MSDESLLIERARDGDAEAFGRLVQDTMRKAYRVALGLVGSHEDALDLSQDAFARAYRARRKLDPSRPFYPWYYQILRRLCFNFVRDRQRHRQKLQEQQSWLADGLSGRLPRPDRQAVRGELRRKLEEAIDQLPPHEREVFVLKEFEDLRYKDIAQLAGIPMGTVMSRLYSARRRLANQLEEWR